MLFIVQTPIDLAPAGHDRVRASGIRGGPRTPFLKVSIAYFYGYKSVGTLVYAWPDAYAKAKIKGDTEAMKQNSAAQVALIGPLIQQTTDPYAFYASMRREHPVAHDGVGKLGIWSIFRYDEARQVLADHTLFSSDPKTGKRRNLGTFKSLQAAKKHERAVQFFKRH